MTVRILDIRHQSPNLNPARRVDASLDFVRAAANCEGHNDTDCARASRTEEGPKADWTVIAFWVRLIDIGPKGRGRGRRRNGKAAPGAGTDGALKPGHSGFPHRPSSPCVSCARQELRVRNIFECVRRHTHVFSTVQQWRDTVINRLLRNQFTLRYNSRRVIESVVIKRHKACYSQLLNVIRVISLQQGRTVIEGKKGNKLFYSDCFLTDFIELYLNLTHSIEIGIKKLGKFLYSSNLFSFYIFCPFFFIFMRIN